MSEIKCRKCHKAYFDLEDRICICGGVIAPTRGKIGENFWTDQKILAGFRRFLNESGHFPTAQEVDKCNYLPAARSIQRTFGGLVNLRKKFNLEIDDYTKGEHRSKIAVKLNISSRNLENSYFGYLKKIFGEMFVHREKPISEASKIRYDFFVYSRSGDFAIDIFRPSNIKNLAGCINIKIAKLNNEENNVRQYLINLNQDITQNEIDNLIQNKKIKIPKNITVITDENFKLLIENQANPYEIAN